MIYDCFTYFNEDLLLELRLNYLNEIVDKFVIVEANKTHSGKSKQQNFDINKFKQFADKIIYVFLEDLPDATDPWMLENIQRNYIHEVLKKNNAKDDDIIIVSDLDEIPTIESISYYQRLNVDMATFMMKFYNYYLNLLAESEPPWLKAKIFKYKEFKKPVESLSNQLRNICLIPECNETNTATRIRLRYMGLLIGNGGWHFSWLGGPEKIKQKLQSFAHQEWNKEELTNIKHIEESLKEHKSVINLKCSYKKVEIDDTYPKYLRDNLDKFKDYIL